MNFVIGVFFLFAVDGSVEGMKGGSFPDVATCQEAMDNIKAQATLAGLDVRYLCVSPEMLK